MTFNVVGVLPLCIVQLIEIDCIHHPFWTSYADLIDSGKVKAALEPSRGAYNASMLAIKALTSATSTSCPPVNVAFDVRV